MSDPAPAPVLATAPATTTATPNPTTTPAAKPAAPKPAAAKPKPAAAHPTRPSLANRPKSGLTLSLESHPSPTIRSPMLSPEGSPPGFITTPMEPTTTTITEDEKGWKVTIKASDGSVNSMRIEGAGLGMGAAEHHEDVKKIATPAAAPAAAKKDTTIVTEKEIEDLEKAPVARDPPKQSRTLHYYLLGQYTLNTALAISIIAIMIFTLSSYNRTKSMAGAWPTTTILSPTLLMLAVSCINVLVDSALLLVQCCGAQRIGLVGQYATKIKTFMGTITTILPVAAVGHQAMTSAMNTGSMGPGGSGAQDLWQWSCSPAADAMSASNAGGPPSAALCTGNTYACVAQILQIVCQALTTIIPLYATYRPKPDGPTAVAAPAGKKGAAPKKVDEDSDGSQAAIASLLADSKFLNITGAKAAAKK